MLRGPLLQDGHIEVVDLSRLYRHPRHVRDLDLEAVPLDALAEDMQLHGQYRPVVGFVAENAAVLVVLGWKRVLAAPRAGIQQVLCWLTDGDDDEAILAQLEDDAYFHEFTLEAEDALLQRLFSLGYSDEQMSRIIQTSRRNVARKVERRLRPAALEGTLIRRAVNAPRREALEMLKSHRPQQLRDPVLFPGPTSTASDPVGGPHSSQQVSGATIHSIEDYLPTVPLSALASALAQRTSVPASTLSSAEAPTMPAQDGSGTRQDTAAFGQERPPLVPMRELQDPVARLERISARWSSEDLYQQVLLLARTGNMDEARGLVASTRRALESLHAAYMLVSRYSSDLRNERDAAESQAYLYSPFPDILPGGLLDRHNFWVLDAS